MRNRGTICHIHVIKWWTPLKKYSEIGRKGKNRYKNVIKNLIKLIRGKEGGESGER